MAGILTVFYFPENQFCFYERDRNMVLRYKTFIDDIAENIKRFYSSLTDFGTRMLGSCSLGSPAWLASSSLCVVDGIMMVKLVIALRHHEVKTTSRLTME